MLSAPLSHDDEERIEKAGGLGIIFETTPQLIIQLLVALHDKQLNDPIGFALLISAIQLSVAISKYGWLFVIHCKKKKKGNSDESLDNMPYTELVDEPVVDIQSRRHEIEKELRRLDELEKRQREAASNH